jgi:hypothetical protein
LIAVGTANAAFALLGPDAEGAAVWPVIVASLEALDVDRNLAIAAV